MIATKRGGFNNLRHVFKEHFPRPVLVSLRPKLEYNAMLKLSAAAFIVTLTAPLPAFAYTQADADACTPDALRLCQNAIPDPGRVALCLAQNKAQLSVACAAVFNRPAAASATRERPGNLQQTKY
jgi:hypothetical protein